MIDNYHTLMEITYDNQFEDEPLEQIPDPDKRYFLTESFTTIGFTYLFKLLALIEKRPILIDKIHTHIKDINIRICGWTVLHFVCNNYKSDILVKVIQILLDAGVDMNAVNNMNNTVLHIACGNYESDKLSKVVKILVNAGINVNIKNYNYRTALHEVCMYHKSDRLPKIIKLLVDFDADVDAKNKSGSTPLHIVCANYKSVKLLEVLRILIDYGSNVNIPDNYNYTPLKLVCEFYKSDKLPEVVLLLIKDMIDLDTAEIIKINKRVIYETIITYYKHDSRKIKLFYRYFDKEQKKLLKCFSQFKLLANQIRELYNNIYYCPNNIGALLCESNFASCLNNCHCSNKLQFLFNSKN